MSFTGELPSAIEASDCIDVAVQVYNPAGLFSTAQAPLIGCTPDQHHHLVVLDAVGDWNDDNTYVLPISLEPNNHWPFPDREFTGSSNQLSAVWPTLRHGHFLWKVVSSEDIERFAFLKSNDILDYQTYHCASPEVLACGETTVR